MDSLIVTSKLESLRRCVKRIEERRTRSAEELRASIDLQDIVSVNITRAVQLCVDVAAHVLTDLEQPAPQTMEMHSMAWLPRESSPRSSAGACAEP